MPMPNDTILLAKVTDTNTAGGIVVPDFDVSQFKTVYTTVWINSLTGTSIQYWLYWKDDFGNYMQAFSPSGVANAVSTVSSATFGQLTFLTERLRLRSVATAVTVLNANICIYGRYQ